MRKHEGYIERFVSESNAIEGIYREPTDDEIMVTEDFICLKNITVADVCNVVNVFQPNAVLRVEVGLDAFVGEHVAPKGCPEIWDELEKLLTINDPWGQHCSYEDLHPFTDGNGRSGRAIWLHKMLQNNRSLPDRLFMQEFYYQTLEGLRGMENDRD